jgi:hypothetical protein
VLCHSRSPFITTVTLIRRGCAAALLGCGDEDWLGTVGLTVVLGFAGGEGAVAGWSFVQLVSMISKPHETAACRVRADLKSEPSRTRRLL